MYKNKSLLKKYWSLGKIDERLVLSSSQKNNLSPILSKLLFLRNIKDDNINDFLNPNLNNNIPNPFLLKDMDNAVSRVCLAIKNKEKIGIIADYDVDGSTSAAILYKFLNYFSDNIFIKIPNRLSEGYGPNIRIMNEMLKNKITLMFTLDCGTSSYGIIDKQIYNSIDVVVIDHHLSETILPKVHSIINPNRFDEDSKFDQMAAVGVTFLFLMALRKKLRDNNFFNKLNKEPNLLTFLDLVALGTVCDVVSLTSYNRIFVKTGLELIKLRKNIGIAKIIDNSKINKTPTSTDLGFIIGPQLNAASRIDNSFLAAKLLISNNIGDVESISKKLNLLNEKRKLIENNIYQEALDQAVIQKDNKFILVYGDNWHNGVLGIIASKLINEFYKPVIVISFINNIGIGSARSIDKIDLGKVILEAKNNNILLSGGGHKMAAGLKINLDNLIKFKEFLTLNLNLVTKDIYKKIDFYDSEISCNDIKFDLLEGIDVLEPFGSGNPEPTFIIKDLNIDSIRILKEKHILLLFQNDFLTNLKGICFNCVNTQLGDYLLNFRNYKLAIGCYIRRDSFSKNEEPQLIIKDAMIID